MHAILRVFSQQDTYEAYQETKDTLNGVLKKKDSAGNGGDTASASKRIDRKKMVTEMNQRMFSAVEMLEIYVDINTTIMNLKKHKSYSKHFKTATQQLSEIKFRLQQLSIDFGDPEHNEERYKTAWNYYNKDLIDDDMVDKAIYQQLPTIMNTTDNLQMIDQIGEAAKNFHSLIRVATKSRCCYCKYNQMFGTLDQSLLMLEKNFEGKQFIINGYKGVKLDCMFIPCTNEDKVNVNLDNPQGDYLSQPTFIICNPNALIYQQMVTAPNSYWLSFFLKRGINVMCWNYRGYGLSKSSICASSINPYNCKLDAEKVLDFLLHKIQVTGKIGVYGRSLGGIASTHLANKFPSIIKAIIVDRTFCELDMLSKRKLYGKCTEPIYRCISFNWKALNDQNFADAPCYKILTCDPQDDVVDNYSSLPVGTAIHLAHNDYSEIKWKKFYECLCLIFDIEDTLYSKMTDKDQQQLQFRLAANLTDTMNQYNSKQSITITINEEDASQDFINTSKQGDDNEQLLSGEINYVEQKLDTKVNLSFIKDRVRKLNQYQELHFVLHRIVTFLNDFKTSTLQLNEHINLSKRRDFKDFRIFLKVLEVYGCGYEDDINNEKFHNREKISHSQQAIAYMSEFIELYQQSIQILKAKKLVHFGNLIVLKNNILQFLQLQIDCWQDLIKIQEQKTLDSDYDNLESGHLVWMKCGHRGKPSRIEEKRISRLLRKSGFIPMLEELYKNKNSPSPKKKDDDPQLTNSPRHENNTSKITMAHHSMEGLKLNINLEMSNDILMQREDSFGNVQPDSAESNRPNKHNNSSVNYITTDEDYGNSNHDKERVFQSHQEQQNQYQASQISNIKGDQSIKTVITHNT